MISEPFTLEDEREAYAQLIAELKRNISIMRRALESIRDYHPAGWRTLAEAGIAREALEKIGGGK